MLNLTTDGKRARPGTARRNVAGFRTFARLGCGWSGLGLGVLLLAAGPAPRSRAATFVVSNTLDSGSGSFRQAILDANASNGLDTITFRIPGAGAHTISPLSPLPEIKDPVVIDATSQPGFAGSPVIELNGAHAGSGTIGLVLDTSGSVVRGLVINGFNGGGLEINAGTNSIQGNYIGLDVTGTLSRPNGNEGSDEGIFVVLSWNNVIGGTNVSDRNVISSSGGAGIYLNGGGGHVILGNFIGTTAGGTKRLANGNNGILAYTSATNVIGGATPGAGNVIAGNGVNGIYLFGPGSTGNVVQGNYVGTDVTGSLALSNTANGIMISGAPSNLIGGTASGAGNVILANSEAGIFITGSEATNNLVQGNSIGASSAGGQALGNGYAGLTMADTGGNIIGGTVAGAGNVISGNSQDGIFATNATGIVVQGNLIGTDSTGTAALGNVFNGITIAGGSSNLIGGTVSGAGNVISGNLGNGISLQGGATANLIQGNYIGPDVSGGTAVSNGLAGVLIQGAGNTIGGASKGAGNVISGNGSAGVGLIGSGAAGNVIQGNKVGTDVSGLKAMGNFLEGIYVQDASTNTLGGVSPGAGNLISANYEGIWLTNASSWNVVQGNWIGTASDGISDLGNTEFGVICDVGANHNLIGGTAPRAGNRIGYSKTVPGFGTYAGVRVRDGATNNAILGNSVFANAGLGIDLGAYGVNPNVPCEAGTSGWANLGQNYPVLTQAVTGPYGTGIRGTLNSRPSSVFLLEFFADAMPDASGYGQGQVWLGDKTVATGADCTAAFVALLTNPVPAGCVVTATATDAANNTSEFAADIAVLPVPALTIMSPSNAGQPGPGSSQIVLAWTNTVALALEQASSLVPPVQWTVSTNVPVLTSSNRWVVALTNAPANQFYRLSFE
jgi:titin